MKLTFLGTGCAQGVPSFRCKCIGCEEARKDPSRQRASTCAVLEDGDTCILIDAGVSELPAKFPDYSAAVLTHFHPDHMIGLFHIRMGWDTQIDVFCPDDPEGYGDFYTNHGALNFSPLDPLQSTQVESLKITAVPLNHTSHTQGYCFESETLKVAFLTDTCGLPDVTSDFLKEWQTLQYQEKY